MKSLIRSILFVLGVTLTIGLAQSSISPDFEAMIQGVTEDVSAQVDEILQDAYEAYLARFEYMSLEDFSRIYLENMNSDPSWYPGAHCDRNSYTDDYCGEKPLTYFTNLSVSDLEQFSNSTFTAYCPKLFELYEIFQSSHPSLPLNLFLEALFNHAHIEVPLGNPEEMLKTSCSPIVTEYERNHLLGLQISFSEYVLHSFLLLFENEHPDAPSLYVYSEGWD